MNKRLALALFLIPSLANSQVPVTFGFYASPIKLYQCAGYSSSTCMGFETSLAPHVVQSLGIKVTSTNPLQFQVSAFIDNMPYKGYSIDGNNTGQPFQLTDTIGSFTTITMTLVYAKTLHCLKACVARYLPESGTVTE